MSIINDPFGVILIGAFVSLLLFGIVIMQTFIYYDRYPNDKMWIKLFIAALFSIDVATTIFTIWWMYDMFVDNWGEISAFTSGNWLLAIDPILAGVMAFMVQCFFGWRIQVITGNKILTGIVGFGSLLTICGGIGTGIAVLWVRDYSRFASFRPIAVIWLISAAVCDIIIALVLTHHLRRHKGSFHKTDKFINKIIKLTVQNGLLTALVAVVDISLYLATEKPYHIALSFLMPKLYSNTALSSLNARPARKVEWHNTTSVDPSRTTDVMSTNPSFLRSAKTDTRTQEVFVNIETHELRDTPHSKRSDNESTTWESLPGDHKDASVHSN